MIFCLNGSKAVKNPRAFCYGLGMWSALVTKPERRQRVQTFIRFTAPVLSFRQRNF